MDDDGSTSCLFQSLSWQLCGPSPSRAMSKHLEKRSNDIGIVSGARHVTIYYLRRFTSRVAAALSYLTVYILFEGKARCQDASISLTIHEILHLSQYCIHSWDTFAKDRAEVMELCMKLQLRSLCSHGGVVPVPVCGGGTKDGASVNRG